MTESELKSLLQQKYNQQNWKEILSGVFTNVEYFTSSHMLAEKDDEIKLIRQIGNISLTDGNIGIFEVEISNKIVIARSRVKLRELTAKYIDQDKIHGAFVFYYSPKQNDYRFTFIAKKNTLSEEGELVKFQTPAKRYTYVLGPNESCTTAAKRFLELSLKENILFENVIQAFSVEKLTKEFFKKYKEHYEHFCEYLAISQYRKSVFNIPNHKDKKENSNAEKPIRDFVKLLLGRIVFLHFLQKKGWLGCRAGDKNWEEGDPQFLNNLFLGYKDKNLYLSKCLNKLFFDTLNTKREDDIFEITQTRVPYLNGGLFDNLHPEYNQINFPSNLFERLFDFFSQYNFTIDENSPDEHEVGIDPEMLGHIFENLLEDNKDKGAFYTPKEIVHYMCHESLIQYLNTHLSPMETDKGQLLESFIHNQELSQFIRDNAKEIDMLLNKVKICDPAIGSGAFPMGLLKEIFQAKILLHPHIKPYRSFKMGEVKRNIIQNSIYGVDFDSGAVDIARLRFWLSLVVDEEEPTPLPNLDYKIMQGNSLLENYLGIDLKFEPAKLKIESYSDTDLFGRLLNPQLEFTEFLQTKEEAKIFNITELEEEFFNSKKVDQKKLIREKLDKFEREFIIEQLGKKIDEINLKLSNKKKDYKEFLLFNDFLFNQVPGNNKAKKDLEKALKQKQKFDKEIKQLKDELLKINNGIEQIKTMKLEEKPYFLWYLYFMDVFHQGGFDIVIGNPPYINVENLEESLKNYLFDKYTSCFGRTDIYIAFIEKSLEILVKNGCLTFIVPYAFTNQKYGSKLRKKLIDNYTISEILDTSDFFVFDSANVKNIIIRITNAHKTKSTVIKNVNNILEFQHDILNINLIDQNAFLQLKDYRLETKPVLDTLQLRDKILHNSIQFADICFVAYGARLNHKTKKINKDNYVKKIFVQGLKPFLEGKNIDRFIHSQSGWLDYRPKEHYNPMFEQLFENEKLMFINVVKDKLRFTIDTKNLWNSHTVVNCVKWNLLESAEHVSIKRNITEKRKELSSRFNYKYLLAVLNSNLINWYFKSFLSEKLHFYPDDAKGLPLRDCTIVKQKPFIKIVDKILEAKQQGADTTALENEIDIMVYKLYNLTYEEVEIIDPEIEKIISKVEYGE